MTAVNFSCADKFEASKSRTLCFLDVNDTKISKAANQFMETLRFSHNRYEKAMISSCLIPQAGEH